MKNQTRILPFARQNVHADGQVEKYCDLVEYLPLVKKIARKMVRRLPASVEYDDLVGAGTLGLLDAWEKFDQTKNTQFKTYAEYRIRGAILDEMRKMDWMPRSQRDKIKKADACDNQLKNNLISLEDYRNNKAQIGELMERNVQSYSEDSSLKLVKNESWEDYYGQTPCKVLSYFSSVRFIHKIINNNLSESESAVMRAYYFEHKNLREISDFLGLTESRISQLHIQAKMKLKKWLEVRFESYEDMVA